MKKIPNNNRPKKIPSVVELPTNPVDMEKYVKKNRISINDKLLDSIDYAIRKRFDGIEVFAFKNSNYVVLVNKKDFRDNLQNIFDYSLENEYFETCAKAKKVIELMDKHAFVVNIKKINQNK